MPTTRYALLDADFFKEIEPEPPAAPLRSLRKLRRPQARLSRYGADGTRPSSIADSSSQATSNHAAALPQIASR